MKSTKVKGLPAFADRQWSELKANQWYEEKGWLLGCNYAPSTAVNQLEMWESETFDPITIERELGWAANLGFNSIRVFLHDLLWKHDSQGLLNRMETFLRIADSHGIGVMFVLFDSVWNPFPEPGKREYKMGVHNSGWLQSPGLEVLKNPKRHNELEDYVKGVLTHFANDKRIHVWDLYNEPCNRNIASYGAHEPEDKADLALVLLRKVFTWAREVNPSQPLTSGVWVGEWTENEIKELDQFMLESSDVITFHNYDSPEEMERRIIKLQRFNRPVLCTEYMARGFNNTFESIIPIFEKHKVSGYNWGLVAGKTQTSYPWDSWTVSYAGEPSLWFHDIFRADGTPYKEEEINYLSRFKQKKNDRPAM
ncbi:cellulase family glycosylhydrolase [Chryseosolibacter indicus]|uniref:Cellulase family glycosylhydrolase n=1 Tax=Chryseosolibacter indicus TaxID=2782351 RepID=A0ABS5VM79_9BACT|nr:cellulase family glycosylhydrolase [Chryseosolibacter indicus]MBT1702549.1 cellulase family glycosylhydrolase [Chryseosolibacter indicus]